MSPSERTRLGLILRVMCLKGAAVLLVLALESDDISSLALVRLGDGEREEEDSLAGGDGVGEQGSCW